MDTSQATARPTRWERFGLVLLILVLIVFGWLVVFRSALADRRMGDVGCYLRAAWAVRTGHDLYDVTCDNNWHYNYPPLLAILMAPLADPPRGEPAEGMLPMAVSVGIWYAFNLLCLTCAVHWLASALEQSAADPARGLRPLGCRVWWALRLIPILACLTPVGHTLMRGQVNLLILALLCGMAALLMRGRSWWAGVVLAGAACVKVLPAFLVLYPLWRRDWRCLAGYAAGLVVGLGVIPLLVFGPERTVTLYQKWGHVLLAPALGGGSDQSRARELTEVWATDTQAPLAAIHHTLTPDRTKRTYPPQPWVRYAHWAIGGGLTLLTLLVARWRRRDDPLSIPLFLGALTVPMLLLSPVCHRHYFAICVLPLAAILADLWERRPYPRLGWGTGLFLIVYGIANAITLFRNTQVLRGEDMGFWKTMSLRFELLTDLGIGMYAALGLWLFGLWRLARRNWGAAHQVSIPGTPEVESDAVPHLARVSGTAA